MTEKLKKVREVKVKAWAVINNNGKIGNEFSNELEIYPNHTLANKFGVLKEQGDSAVECVITYII